jgi:SagB-type dehydrogenase family enzyme
MPVRFARLTAVKPARRARAMMLAMLAMVSLHAAADVPLPGPRRASAFSLEGALAGRHSVREYKAAALSLEELGQLAWAAQGVLDRSGRRTAPSAGATYPLQLFVVAGNVEGLAPGVYRYQPALHRLAHVADGERRKALAQAALGQQWIEQAAAVFAIAALERRTTGKYGQRGVRYVHMEAGHAAQNLLLQAVALGLGAAPVGAFGDAEVHAVVGLDSDARALYLIPVGQPR